MTALPAANLDARILAAHANGDGPVLASLYAEAADTFAGSGDTDTACFFYTQAFIFALEAGLPLADRCGEILRANRRL